jgi:hypothetical protein
MTGSRAWRLAWCAAGLLLVGCASTVTPPSTSSSNYLQQYASAGGALDTATTTWDTLGKGLVTTGTNTIANEAPIDAAYARALSTFSNELLAIQFPASTKNDVHNLVNAAGAVRNDLAGVASGAVSTTQFVNDEANLQNAINIVQHELGLGSSTPIAGS